MGQRWGNKRVSQLNVCPAWPGWLWYSRLWDKITTHHKRLEGSSRILQSWRFCFSSVQKLFLFIPICALSRANGTKTIVEVKHKWEENKRFEDWGQIQLLLMRPGASPITETIIYYFVPKPYFVVIKSKRKIKEKEPECCFLTQVQKMGRDSKRERVKKEWIHRSRQRNFPLQMGRSNLL
jgi:hypothetical protein